MFTQIFTGAFASLTCVLSSQVETNKFSALHMLHISSTRNIVLFDIRPQSIFNKHLKNGDEQKIHNSSKIIYVGGSLSELESSTRLPLFKQKFNFTKKIRIREQCVIVKCFVVRTILGKKLPITFFRQIGSLKTIMHLKDRILPMIASKPLDS